jgi:hypothetical protein
LADFGKYKNDNVIITKAALKRICDFIVDAIAWQGRKQRGGFHVEFPVRLGAANTKRCNEKRQRAALTVNVLRAASAGMKILVRRRDCCKRIFMAFLRGNALLWDEWLGHG